MPFVKNRTEQDTFELGFTQRLAAGETIESATVVVEWAALYVWNDVTADVLLGTPTISTDGKTVQFVLTGASAPEKQPSGQYRVVVTALTSTSRQLVGTPDLQMTS